jgi:hypothetical protein
MTRYVIDAPTLLHLIANDVRISPDTNSSLQTSFALKAYRCLFEAVTHGDLTEDLAPFSTMSGSPN